MPIEMRPLKLATVPVGGSAVDYRTADFEKGMAAFPYFVAVGSSDTPLLNILGILLHVAAWVVAFVADVIVITKVDPNADSSTYTDKQFFDYQMASLVPFGLGFALVLIGIVYHWVVVGILHKSGFTKETLSKKDKLPKSIEAVLKGAVAVGILFAFIVIQFPQTGLQDQSDAQSMRTWMIVSIVSKIMVSMFLSVNFGAKGGARVAVLGPEHQLLSSSERVSSRSEVEG